MTEAATKRESETQQRYLGDGVYASFDGYQIWLRVDREEGVHEIALDGHSMEYLANYAADLGFKWRKK